MLGCNSNREKDISQALQAGSPDIKGTGLNVHGKTASKVLAAAGVGVPAKKQTAQ